MTLALPPTTLSDIRRAIEILDLMIAGKVTPKIAADLLEELAGIEWRMDERNWTPVWQ